MEQRRLFLKEVFDTEPGWPKETKTESEMRIFLKRELDISFENNIKVKQLSVTQRNLVRMRNFRKKTEK